ncbi:MAG TPA: transcription termination factor Rho [Acidimicrobiales bacterium]|nr:transcription termination factor Rho [Acidimicrobiales bacterium]
MSVDSTTLERSALERKDREELTTIAQALGAKPSSRARKAEIVQLILELTGVASSEASGTEERGTKPKRARAGNDGSNQEATVDEADSGADTTTTTTTGAPNAAAEAAAADEPPAEWEAAAVDEPEGGSGAATSTEDDRSGGSNGQARAATAERTERGRSTRTATEGEARGGGREGRPADGRQREPERTGEQSHGEAQQEAQQVDVNEPGNRRRRRRGRRGGTETHVEDYTGEPLEVEGLLDLRDEGYGFLRVKGSLPSKDDVYVSVKQARQFGLRKGDHIKGGSRPALRNEKNPALLRIDLVNGQDPEEARRRRRFEDLTPLFPDEKLALETTDDGSNMTARIVDLLSPIGKGQRGLIVSPPKAGKTTIMKQIARSIEANNPEVKLIVLLVDERPEEVTDMRRWLRSPASEVVASTFDRPSEEHAQVAELTIERAKRLVEDGRDVCIILDGITRLARAYNLAAPATGRIMSGGVDSGALYPPKKFFGAARNIEEGGSLTILATALIETGSKMDEVIFEEFKGTGNMELRLDRRLSERRIYPAIDVDASSTRHEELLFPRGQLNLVWALRRVLSGLSSTDGGNAAALELLIDRMKTFRTNEEFLAEVAKNRLAAG